MWSLLPLLVLATRGLAVSLPRDIQQTQDRSAFPSNHNDGAIEWQKLTSTNGNPYQTGSPPSTSNVTPRTPSLVPRQARNPLHIWNVNWPVTSDSSRWFSNPNPDDYVHVDGPGDIRARSGIGAYYLMRGPKLSVFRYKLLVGINGGPMGTYRFYDASGDSYKLGVWLGIGASHYIYFNSRDPRIVKVTFESSDDDKVYEFGPRGLIARPYRGVEIP